jgi:hypothetical protein
MTYIPHCIVDPNNTLSLLGSSFLEDLDKSTTISKINLMVKRCKNSSTTACSSDEEIDKWLHGKLFEIAYMNYRLSLQPPDSFSLK